MQLAKMGAIALVSALGVVGASSAPASNLQLERFGNVFAMSVCGRVSMPGQAHCFAKVVTDARGNILENRHGGGRTPSAALPSGYGPADLQSAYALASAAAANGGGKTIAIVDAYGYTNAESDLAVYRSAYGLKACTTANGCFKKVNQSGVQGNYPRTNTGWDQEQALDLDMVSAICPNCNILLVQASSTSFASLSAAVDTAAALGATAISNSYGGSEYSSEVTDQQHYNHPGIAVTVSSGDNGYGVEFPAASQYVTAVGGTSLRSSGSGWTETVWNGAGSGCSAYITKPNWQTDGACSKRVVADVSAVADPNTGVAVYGPSSRSRSAWMVFGGTSVASPLIAAVYGLAGVQNLAFTYGHASSLRDVTSGSNGSCGGTLLCTGMTGYDGPTGLGTPVGTGAF